VCAFDRDLGGPALDPDIKKEINMFQLEGYAQHYFRTVKKGLFKRTVPVRDLLVWSKVTHAPSRFSAADILACLALWSHTHWLGNC
jgi:hypothetical protein